MLAQVPGVKDVTEEKDGDISSFNLRSRRTPTQRGSHASGHSSHWTVRELTRRRPTLEDVFVELTHSDS